MGTKAEQEPLRVADRCDRCHAQAVVRAIFTNGGELWFCGHHHHQHQPQLRSQAALFDQGGHRILELAPAS